jgi:hypothetical protein
MVCVGGASGSSKRHNRLLPACGLRDMIWPAPRKSERVELVCTCHTTVAWRIPLMFLYSVRINQKGRNCARLRHVNGRRVFTFLEAIARRV